LGRYDLIMRRIATILLLVAASAAAFGAGQPPPPRHIEFSQDGRAALEKVSTYLNQLRSLEGDFTQIGPNGQLDQGRVFILKPGRLRFEYRPPSPLLVISDGQTVAVFNSKMKTVDRYPLSSTPLDLLLGDKIDLLRNDAILSVQHNPGTIVVEARTAKKRVKPNIIITFAESPMELRQWTVIDDQGLSTTVALRNVETGVPLDDKLFVLRESKAPNPRN
jgi:outer membrane lipoprotein-sorting protein